MRYSTIALLVIVLSSACAEAPCPYPDSVINYCNAPDTVGTSVQPQIDGKGQHALEILNAQVYLEYCLGERLDLSKVTFHIMSHDQVMNEYRGEAHQSLVAFTRFTDEYTDIFLTTGRGDEQSRTETIVHELGHWYYNETTGNGDDSHVHNIWFGREDHAPWNYGGLNEGGSVSDCAQYRSSN